MGLTEALDLVPLDGRLGSAAMDVSSQVGGVTPRGVRDGDPATLQALVERRGPAVMAFCSRVCGPNAATRASAEAFARFRAAVRDAIDLNTVDPEILLRGATRHAAASMARQPSGPPPTGRLRSRGTQTCEHVPTMLAARANGALGDADLERLARHLDRCERCNAMGEIFRSAEAAYAEPAIDTLGTDTTSVLLAAMQAVPEHPLGAAPAPLPGAPATEPQEGAFGHLPDLEDEVPVADDADAQDEALVVPEAEPSVAEADDADEVEDAEAPDAIDEAVTLPVQHVEQPAADLAPDDLAAEPLPDHAPELTEDDVELGETMEWDMVPIAPQRRTYADVELPPAVPGASALTAAPRRRVSLPSFLKVVLPVLLVVAFAVGALAVSGVLGGNDAAPAPQRAVMPHVQKPVLTPLPVTVPSQTTATTPEAATSTAAPAATASTTSPATGTTATTP